MALASMESVEVGRVRSLTIMLPPPAPWRDSNWLVKTTDVASVIGVLQRNENKRFLYEQREG